MGFFNSTYTGVEQSSSHHLQVGMLSGPRPTGFAVLFVDATAGSASKFFLCAVGVKCVYSGIMRSNIIYCLRVREENEMLSGCNT